MSDETKRPISEAKKRANAKYENKAYDKILLRIDAGKKDEIKAHAEVYQKESGDIGTAGYTPRGSINGFIKRAIDETMERDNGNEPPQTEKVPDMHFQLSPEERAHIEKRRAVLEQLMGSVPDGEGR